MDTSDEWIRERTGIRERHHVDGGVGTSDLAIEASPPGHGRRRRRAFLHRLRHRRHFPLPDHYFPGIGVLVQAKLGLGTTGALDVRNQCSGFLYALSAADQYIRAGTYKRILLVAAEVQSTNLDFSDQGRDMSVLFGDGAGAVILEPVTEDDGRGILSTHLYADGNFASDLWMEKPCPADNPTFQKAFFDEGRFFPRMEGRRVFVNACQRMPEAIRAGLEQNGLAIEDIDALIPHQANDRISLMVAKGLKIPVEKVIRNIDRFGNTSAASIPIALDEAVRSGRIKRGDLVALTAFGSGYTWASAFIRW